MYQNWAICVVVDVTVNDSVVVPNDTWVEVKVDRVVVTVTCTTAPTNVVKVLVDVVVFVVVTVVEFRTVIVTVVVFQIVVVSDCVEGTVVVVVLVQLQSAAFSAIGAVRTGEK